MTVDQAGHYGFSGESDDTRATGTGYAPCSGASDLSVLDKNASVLDRRAAGAIDESYVGQNKTSVLPEGCHGKQEARSENTLHEVYDA